MFCGLQSDPSTQFKELILPVPQVSMQWQLTPKFAVGAYYQLRLGDRPICPGGSFLLECRTIIGDGAERLIAGAPISA